MIEVKVIDSWDTLEKWVYVYSRTSNGEVFILSFTPEERWDYMQPGVSADPTLKLKLETLEKIAGALAEHKPDDDTVREAYLHERARVDKLIDYATQAQVQLWDSSTQGRP